MLKSSFYFLYFLPILFFVACGSDENTNPSEDPVEMTDSMSLKVDGVLFEPEDVVAKEYGVGYNYVIEGVTDRGASNVEILSIFLDSYDEGVYELGIQNNTGVHTQYSRELSSASIYQDITGSVTILSHDPVTQRVNGHFEFEAVNQGSTVSISEGKFNVVYQ